MNFPTLATCAFAALTAFCTTPTALAQGGSVNIRCMALNNTPVAEVQIQTSEGPVTLEFSSVQPTDPVRAMMANPLPLYAAGTAPGSKEGPPPTMVKLPPNSPEILLLAWSSGKETRYLAIKDDFSSSKNDDWLLINTTNAPIAIQVGQDTKAKQVGPGTYEPFKISAPVNEGAAVTAAVLDQKKWRPIYSTYWPIYADQRCIIFFVADGKKIRVKQVSDQTTPTVAAGS